MLSFYGEIQLYNTMQLETKNMTEVFHIKANPNTRALDNFPRFFSLMVIMESSKMTKMNYSILLEIMSVIIMLQRKVSK